MFILSYNNPIPRKIIRPKRGSTFFFSSTGEEGASGLDNGFPLP
jgi:hypothetical protein